MICLSKLPLPDAILQSIVFIQNHCICFMQWPQGRLKTNSTSRNQYTLFKWHVVYVWKSNCKSITGKKDIVERNGNMSESSIFLSWSLRRTTFRLCVTSSLTPLQRQTNKLKSASMIQIRIKTTRFILESFITIKVKI